jgi:hypothetical protein
VIQNISAKVRHFYDIYYLMNTPGCNELLESDQFNSRFLEILHHDQEAFDEPKNWKTKKLKDSPLITDFDTIWNTVRDRYSEELNALSYGEVPNEKKVAASFKDLLKFIK